MKSRVEDLLHEGGLMLVTKQSGFGGTKSAHCLSAKSVRDGTPIPQSHLNLKWHLDSQNSFCVVKRMESWMIKIIVGD